MRRLLVLALVMLAAGSCELRSSSREPDAQSAAPSAVSSAVSSTAAPLSPLPASAPRLDPRRVALGRELFHDKRLSDDGLVSCADCHALGLGGANAQAKSTLPDRPPVGVNVPTIFNLAYNFRYAWNGRYRTIEDQIDFALGTPAAMRNTWSGVVDALGRDARTVEAFRGAYRAGLTAKTARDALASYARSLSTPNARFDRHLRGELTLDATEQRGYEHFRDYGCISCHQGVNVGGNMFERFGVMLENGDPRRYRVPSLRNVALTAPYFHDGSAATLADAIAVMGRYQLGRELSARDVAEIGAFLRTLTGELEGKPL